MLTNNPIIRNIKKKVVQIIYNLDKYIETSLNRHFQTVYYQFQ